MNKELDELRQENKELKQALAKILKSSAKMFVYFVEQDESLKQMVFELLELPRNAKSKDIEKALLGDDLLYGEINEKINTN